MGSSRILHKQGTVGLRWTTVINVVVGIRRSVSVPTYQGIFVQSKTNLGTYVLPLRVCKGVLVVESEPTTVEGRDSVIPVESQERDREI